MNNKVDILKQFLKKFTLEYDYFLNMMSYVIHVTRNEEMISLIKHYYNEHYFRMIKDLSYNNEGEEFKAIMNVVMEQFHILDLLRMDGCKFNKNWFYLAIERCDPNFLENLLLVDVEIEITDETKIIFVKHNIDKEKFHQIYNQLFKLDNRLYGLNIKERNPFILEQY